MDTQQSQTSTQKPYGGTGAPVKVASWGDTMRVRRRTRIEAAPIPQVSAGRGGDTHGRTQEPYITGELLTERYTRGNLHNWDLRTGQPNPNLHPFAGHNAQPKHGVTQYLQLDAPRRVDTQFIASEALENVRA